MNIDTYKLNDSCSCSIAPGWGCNLFSWRVDGAELVYCPEGYPDAANKITDGGNPLLFPALGRTWDHSSGEPIKGVYRIWGNDKTYFMPSHGILFFCHWRKIDESRTSDSITAAYELIVPEKVRADNYPFDMAFEVRFTLRASSVEIETTIENKGSSSAPYGFGYHPYFKISNPQREGVSVSMPVTKHLLLTKDTILLTGESEETDGSFQLKPDIYYDNAFSGVTGQRMTLADRRAGRSIHVDFDKKFELFFLYSPDGSEFVCIEPWTRGLGAYEFLKDANWSNGELIPVLAPGESASYKVAFSAAAL